MYSCIEPYLPIYLSSTAPASSPPLPPAASLALAPPAALPASPASPPEGARAPAMEPDDYDDYAFSSPAGTKVELSMPPTQRSTRGRSRSAG